MSIDWNAFERAARKLCVALIGYLFVFAAGQFSGASAMSQAFVESSMRAWALDDPARTRVSDEFGRCLHGNGGLSADECLARIEPTHLSKDLKAEMERAHERALQDLPSPLRWLVD